MAKSTRSNFFKATEITEDNERRQYIYDLTNDLNTSADNLNTENNVDCGQNVDKQTSINIDFPNTRYRPKADFKFPNRIIGNREHLCQHQSFDEFKWLHYDIRKDTVFYYYCMKHNTKLNY